MNGSNYFINNNSKFLYTAFQIRKGKKKKILPNQ